MKSDFEANNHPVFIADDGTPFFETDNIMQSSSADDGSLGIDFGSTSPFFGEIPSQTVQNNQAPLEDTVIAKSKNFAIRLSRMCRFFASRGEQGLPQKVMESGAQIGLILRQADKSKDFDEYFREINRAIKKADETFYWLELLLDSGTMTKEQFESLSYDCREILDSLNMYFLNSKGLFD